MSRTKNKRKTVFEFLRYNGAGIVFFWSTYILFFGFDQLTNWPTPIALAGASLIAHLIYYKLTDDWVFTEGGKRRKTTTELWRFGSFMTLNFFINIGIVSGLELLGLTPYLGQFVAGFFFTFWNYAGLKLWVFRAPKKSSKNAKRS